MTSRGQMGLPDFYIVGAPKCGTTAMYRYLSEHPAVFMPHIKEPHFFAADFRGIARAQDIDEYRRLFASATPGQLKGEASASYLFSDVALAAVMTARPDAKIVVMLRNPLDAVRSYHVQMLKGLVEDIEDFETAWRAQPDRAAGRRVPDTCPDPKLLSYGPTFTFDAQIARLIALVPESQRHVIIYEEFFADPQTRYAALLAFLGLPPDGRTDFPVFNARKTIRNRTLARFYMSPPPVLRRLWAPFRPLAHALGVYPPELLQTLNTERAAKQGLSPAFAAELTAYFAGQAGALETLLGRSFAAWRRG